MLNPKQMITAHEITATVEAWRSIGAEFYDDGAISRLPFGMERILLAARLQAGAGDWRALAWVATWQLETSREHEAARSAERTAGANAYAALNQRTAAYVSHATAKRLDAH
jgi:hypothetical protein